MPSRPRRPKPDQLVPTIVLLLLVLLAYWLAEDQPGQAPARRQGPPPTSADGYLFCHWNAENFFDDRDDPRNHEEEEDWFARNPDIVRQKVENLANALLLQNNGYGPDILAMVEVESRRAVELLRDALNAHLPSEWQYGDIAYRDYRMERRLAPVVLSRLPILDDETRLFPSRRILQAQVMVNDAPLTILASHWTSRLRDGTEEKREAYAEVLYDAFLERDRSDPAVDLLISGDFNDEPGDPSVRQGLHAVGDPSQIRPGEARPRLLDLMMGRDPDLYGTFQYNGRWQIFDHIVASPGLLDPAGWLILPETLHVEGPDELRTGRNRRPARFGGPVFEGPRGASDHFAVTVRLRVRPPTKL